jgi:hypothetical protein
MRNIIIGTIGSLLISGCGGKVGPSQSADQGNSLQSVPGPSPDPGPAPKAPSVSADAILWQNVITGEASIWSMNGTTRIGGGPITNANSSTTLVPGANYEVVGTADFNGDGTPDILWQNVTTGEASIWYMNGTTRIGGGPITNANFFYDPRPGSKLRSGWYG